MNQHLNAHFAPSDSHAGTTSAAANSEITGSGVAGSGVTPSAAEADALVADTLGLSGAAALLNADALSELLQQPVTPTHVRLKPGRSLLVAHRSSEQPQTEQTGWTALTVDRSKWEKAQLKAETFGTALQQHSHPNCYLFSGDLRGDTALAKEIAHLEEFLHQQPLKVLRYNPRRRVVLSFGEGPDRQVVRVATKSLKPLVQSASAWRDLGLPVGAVRALGRRGTATISPYWGIGDLTLHPEPAAAVTAGTALAALHTGGSTEANTAARKESRTADTRRRHTPDLQAAAETIALLAPWAADRARGIAKRLSARWDSLTPAEPSQIHGDFSPDQVLIAAAGSHKIRLIDFDRARLGDPMQDLGSWAAACRSLQSPALQQALVEGYSEHARISVERVRLWAGCSHLMGAPLFFRRRSPQWPAETEAALTYAEEALDS